MSNNARVVAGPATQQGVARHAQARCILVTDIDCGGAFAHLFGTWALLPAEERAMMHGFVLNKFRGDPALLAPAPQMLQQMTGIPVIATLPMWWQHGPPEEDGVFDDRARANGVVDRTVAVIVYPRISNPDEFQLLKSIRGLRLVWARSPGDCEGADWIILLGPKSTAADLAWLSARGLADTIRRHAERGGAVLGICGGLQMLGHSLVDTHGIDGNATGLGLLPLSTRFNLTRTVLHSRVNFTSLNSTWTSLSGVTVSGYEIHHGETMYYTGDHAGPAVASEVIPGLAWQNAAGNALGCYLHGLFDDPAVCRAWFGSGAPSLDAVFDGLADFVQTHFHPGALDALK